MEGYFHTEKFSNEAYDVDALILAVGFEERSYHSLAVLDLSEVKKIIMVYFDSSIKENEVSFLAAKEIVKNSSFHGKIDYLCLDYHKSKSFEKDLEGSVHKLGIYNEKVYLDVSGFPSYAICQALRVIRLFSLSVEQTIIYTSAKKYFPLKSKYDKVKEESINNDLSPVLAGMSLEMSDNLFLESFSGYRSNASSSCLAIFCGYELHRSSGVIDNMNPSKLIMIYGKPGDSSMEWRLDLSKEVHNRFETTRNTATEVVSTLNMKESLDVLEEYYDHLFNDHDLSIAPVCSKMQSVASYIFWERYKEIQLVFPIPIGHSVEHRARGVSEMYIATLPPVNSLHVDKNRMVLQAEV